MGLYDVNLKKTNIGYQFDRNVYIGIQTNDNRVVTFKDLGNAIVASGGGAGGEDIQLEVSSIESLGSSGSFVDHIAFKRNGVDVAYDILPQYVRAATPDDEDLSQGKVCLLMPVYDEQDPGTLVGYKLYATDQLSMETLQLVIGNTTYTYNGSSAVTVNFNTIPTVAASSVGIVTEIPDSDTSTDIPTAGAVHKFAASAGSLNMTKSDSGYLVGVVQQPTTTTQTLAPVGSEFIKWGTAANSVGVATHWLNANVTGHLNKTFTITIGNATHTFDGSANTSIQFNSIPTVAASSVTITSTIPASESSADIPTAGAVYNYANAINLSYNDTSHIVTFTKANGSSTSFTVASSWNTLADRPSFNSVTLNWGSAAEYMTGTESASITLPTVNTIPTVAASSVEIATSIPTTGSGNAIPTVEAVRNYASTGTLSNPLNLAGVNFPGTVTFTGATTTTVSGGDHIVGSVSTSTAGTQINLNTTHHYTIQPSDIEPPSEPDPDSPLIGATLSLELSAKLRSHEWSFTLPREITGFVYDVEFYFGGVYEDYIVVYCLALNMGAFGVGLLEETDDERLRIVNAAPWLYYRSVSPSPNFGEQVILGYMNDEPVSFFMPWLDITDATLTWGSTVPYATVRETTHYLTLPTVNTIPTVAASSMAITDTVSSGSAAAQQIPTAAAVWSIANAAGKVKEIRIGGVTQSINEGVVDLPTYSINDRTITIGTQSTTWTNTAGLSWNPTSHAVTSSLDGTSAVIPTATTIQPGLVVLGDAATKAAPGNHAHKTFNVFGQTYTGATARTVAAGTGITTTTSGTTTTISLDASLFNNTTLAWGTSVSYMHVGAATRYLSLPTVNTIPTVAASSTEITSTVNSSSTAAQIPTAAAVWAAVSAAPGTVTAISMNGSSYTPVSGVVTLPTYALTDHTITIGSTSVTVPAFSYDATTGVLTIDINN